MNWQPLSPVLRFIVWSPVLTMQQQLPAALVLFACFRDCTTPVHVGPHPQKRSNGYLVSVTFQHTDSN